MSATGHALLSPSSSHRWINCTPSARLEENETDSGSVFAEEGSVAHALCELKLLTLLDGGSGIYGEEIRKAKEEVVAGEKYIDNEMQECSDSYAADVWGKYNEALQKTPDAKLLVEVGLDFGKYIPDSFGTADAIIIADGQIEVIDFKYGKGVEVSAVENTQMMIYALGAIEEFGGEYDIKSVCMTIIQPRKANISEYTMTAVELSVWAYNVLIPTARLADKGEGEQVPGEWCRFCKIKATCAALANRAIATYTQHEVKERIGDAEMPDILKLIPSIKSWCTAVEDYATAQAVNGKVYEGYKIVEGRSVRKISDPEALADVLAGNGYNDVYKPLELKTIGDLEKMVGKKRFAELSQDFIERAKGKPSLVPESDRRPPMDYTSAEEEFKNINL